MATIAENLQTIADSTNAIKQAIIDKGGNITGDITTWASAINGISGGSGGEEGGGTDSDSEINNVYISLTSTYIAAPGAEEYTIFCSLEKPLDVPMEYYLVSYDGAQINRSYNTLNSGITEFEVHVTLNPMFSPTIEKDFAITICGGAYYGDIHRSKYTFKYNYL